jgi:hypothetical protein
MIKSIRTDIVTTYKSIRRRGRRRRNKGRGCRQKGYIMALQMESLTECIRRWFYQWFRQWKCHVTVRLTRFESVGHSIGKIVWKNSTSPHRCIFPNKLYRPSVIRSVYTDRIGDGIISIGKNYRQKKFVGNFVGFRRFSGSEI